MPSADSERIWLDGVARFTEAWLTAPDRLFAVWSETVHEMLKSDGSCSCDILCWQRLPEAERRRRFSGSALSFETLLARVEATVSAEFERRARSLDRKGTIS